MTFISAASVVAITTLYTKSAKVYNNADVTIQARSALDKMTSIVRQARCIGDASGSTTQVDTLTEDIFGSTTFPSSDDPVYGATAPTGGWPTWADGSTPTSFTVGPTCLIVQVPIFDSNGFPYCIPANTGNPGNPDPVDNCDTYVFRVLKDPDTVNNADSWVLQMAKFPGLSTSTTPGTSTIALNGPVMAPRTLVTGIIGPKDSTGNPVVFQYLDNSDSTGTPMTTIAADNLSLYTRVIVNLDLINHDSASKINGGYNGSSSFGLKSEIFLRNNAGAATTAGAQDTSTES